MNKIKKLQGLTYGLFITLLLVIILFFMFYFDVKNERIASNDYYESHLVIDKEEYKRNVIKFANAARVAQYYMPEYFVYYGINGIQFSDLNPDLIQNTYHTNESLQYFKLNGDQLSYDDGDTYTTFGIDISQHQVNVDWDLLKQQGVEYAFIRVGYRGYESGKINLDKEFNYNIENANRVGIPVGVYFFSGAINTTEAIEEANFVLNEIKDYDVELEVVFDMEEIEGSNNRMKDLSKQDRTDISIAYLETIKNNGYSPMMYGNARWLMDCVDFMQLKDYSLWYANYSNFTWPYKVDYYQYTESGKMNGINGGVDFNIKFIK